MRQAVEYLGGDSRSAAALETSQLDKLGNLRELARCLKTMDF